MQRSEQLFLYLGCDQVSCLSHSIDIFIPVIPIQLSNCPNILRSSRIGTFLIRTVHVPAARQVIFRLVAIVAKDGKDFETFLLELPTLRRWSALYWISAFSASIVCWHSSSIPIRGLPTYLLEADLKKESLSLLLYLGLAIL